MKMIILKKLQIKNLTIENENCFVDKALLEKFERDGIELSKIEE